MEIDMLWPQVMRIHRRVENNALAAQTGGHTPAPEQAACAAQVIVYTSSQEDLPAPVSAPHNEAAWLDEGDDRPLRTSARLIEHPDLPCDLGVADMLGGVFEGMVENPADAVLPSMAGREPVFR